MNASLLPNNSSKTEKAILDGSADRLDLPTSVIKSVKRPDQSPSDFIPALAYEYSVDVWSPDWDLQKKRNVIANSISLHRLKGTLTGIRAHADLVDAEVISAIRPPQKFFAGPSDTYEQRLEWLKSLPVVKIYRDLGRVAARPAIFAGGTIEPMFLSGRFALPSTSDLRTRKKVLLIRDGVETEIGIGYDHEGTRQVLFLHPAGMRVFAGRNARRFAMPSVATKYVAKILSDQSAYDPRYANPLAPAGTGGGIFPQFDSDPKPIGRAWYAGAIAWKRYAGVSDAEFRSFERIPLSDDLAPNRPVRAVSFASYTRLGVAAHTAELKVLAPGKTSRHAMFASAGFAGRFAVLVDKSRLGNAFAAITAAKRLSDKILIDTEVYRPVLAGQTLLAGQPIFAGIMTRS